MKIERGQDAEPLLTLGASDRFGPAIARHLAMLVETSGGPAGDVAKLRQLAGRMEAWRPAVVGEHVRLNVKLFELFDCLADSSTGLKILATDGEAALDGFFDSVAEYEKPETPVGLMRRAGYQALEIESEATPPDPEPTPTAEPVPVEPEPAEDPEPIELPEAARAGRKGRR